MRGGLSVPPQRRFEDVESLDIDVVVHGQVQVPLAKRISPITATTSLIELGHGDGMEEANHVTLRPEMTPKQTVRLAM